MLKGSVRKKILLMVLLVALTGLGISTISSISNMINIRDITVNYSEFLGQAIAEKSETALLEQVKQNLQNLVEQKSIDHADMILDHYLDDAKKCAEYVSWLYSENGISDLSKEQAEKLLEQLSPVIVPIRDEAPDMLGRIYFASEQGVLLYYDGSKSLMDADEYDYKNASWYQSVRYEQEPMFSEVYDDALGKGLMTTCSAPCYDADGNFIGAIGIDVCLEPFYAGILNVNVSENTIAAIVDANGHLIAGPKVDFSTADFRTVWGLNSADEYTELIQDILGGGTGVGEANDMYFAYAPIHALNWRLIIRVPFSDVIAPVMQMDQDVQTETLAVKTQIGQTITSSMVIFLAVAVVTVCIVAVVSVWFSGRIAEPLRSLQRQVEIISQGNLDVSVKVSSQDEIGVLAEKFNSMTASLKEQMEEIKKVTAEKERIGAELHVASQIQSSMLPSIFPAFTEYPEFDIYATMEPAKEVGGDFYDFFLVDESHLAVVMADVSGKGVPAALFMVIAKTLIKDLTQMGLSPDEVFRQANDKMCEANDEGMFVTAWLGILDIHSGHMDYVNAGHNPPLLYRKHGTFEYLKQKPGFVLAGMEGIRYQSGSIDFDEQDMLYLYTDGVTEATDSSEQLYGEERLKAALDSCLKQNPEAEPLSVLNAVKTDIRAFVKEAPQSDDITMLGLKLLKLEGRRQI